tara:strand:- start:31758 stop:32156 length:399 start_codon:yes stop_codon:yes gene_type:complete
MLNKKHLTLFLRLSIAVGFLSAVADRFGLYSKSNSVWGNWESFLEYTKVINPWFPEIIIPSIGIIVTLLEVVFATFLVFGFKTQLYARLSGFLLLLFALSMAFSIGIKPVLDYSVLPIVAASFALSTMEECL